ncbi:J domain-containing protein [Leptolyngbya ohadii]|uniref:J domain-containing protein n=1 Tax=Leptolyngbya ohadii TaxID=1962290 RepID=UPI000B59D46D|nr:J domain-containing protein [Leptolyngbya ohadii]
MELADCYRLLGLRKGASHDEIKSSYRRLARQYHPDANPSDLIFAKEKFIQLTNAYRQLINTVPPIQPDTPTIDLTQERESRRESPKNFHRKEPATRQPNRTAQSKAPSAQSAKSSTVPNDRPAQAQPKPSAAKPPAPLQNDPSLTVVDRKLKERIYEQLQQLLRENRFAMAVTVIEGLAQRLPNDREVRQWQAITYQRFGRHLINERQLDKARIYLQKALRTDPQNKSLWYEVDREMRRLDQIEVL